MVLIRIIKRNILIDLKYIFSIITGVLTTLSLIQSQPYYSEISMFYLHIRVLHK